MIVRIRLPHGRSVTRTTGKNRHLALGVAALLIPLAVMAYALGFWRLASDVGMAGDFALGGVFAHWQLWMAAAAILHLGAWMLNRYGRGHALEMPRILTSHFVRPRRPTRIRRDRN